MQVWSLGQEDPLEKEMTTYFSILSWRIPWTEEPGRLLSIALQRVWLNWSYLARMHTGAGGCTCCKLATHIHPQALCGWVSGTSRECDKPAPTCRRATKTVKSCNVTQHGHQKCTGCSKWAMPCTEAGDPVVTQIHSLTFRCPWTRGGTGWQTARHRITVLIFLPRCTVSPVHHLDTF